MGQSKRLHQLIASRFAVPNRPYQGCYLVGYLIGGHGLADRISQGAEHKLDKRRSICALVGLCQYTIVGHLAVDFDLDQKGR